MTITLDKKLFPEMCCGDPIAYYVNGHPVSLTEAHKIWGMDDPNSLIDKITEAIKKDLDEYINTR